ncbi:hypothetical protein V8F20_003620 [Naviculisporaceae sp. PSN 640]
MEHPVRDVRHVIRSLCQGTPQEQKYAVNRYYLPSASLVHPFCRVPSFESFKVPGLGIEVSSRDLILSIFKWYKVLSPKIDLEIESAVFDQRSSLLYLTISQVFSIWFIPFYKAPVRLVTVLHLVPSNNNNNQQQDEQQDQRQSNNTNTNGNNLNHVYHHLNGTDEDEPSYAEVASGQAHPSSSPPPSHRSSTAVTNGNSSPSSRSTRYLIKSQEDYYQVNEFLKFLLGIPGAYLWSIWQIFSTIVCVLGAAVFAPLMNLSGLGAWLASTGGGANLSLSSNSRAKISASFPSLHVPSLQLPSLSGLRRDITDAIPDGAPAREKLN